MSSKTLHFRKLLNSPDLSFLMEAHNGLSARIVEESGFQGIWASGLSISTALGVRDRNEASWTQVLEVLEFMADASSIPILLDGDTGYGDFNNFRRLVKKLCQRGVAAVCIEDKIFPKTNSFLGDDQSLANIEEFCGKIKAGKDSQTDENFSVIARVEALIAGWGMDEALKRAEAYRQAGADGILIHSKKSSPDEILFFAKEWANRAPLVIVPTMYYATPTERFREAKISTIIWANHNLRASLAAMRETSLKIFREQSLVGVEENVAKMSDVFAITDNSEVAEAEKRYLPGGQAKSSAVILAAVRGQQLAELTQDKPKCMLDIRGEPLLRRLTRSLNGAGIRDITVVAGYKEESINLPNLKKVVNPDFATTGEVTSLAQGLAKQKADCLIAYGDILFRDLILYALFAVEGDIVLVIDGGKGAESSRKKTDLVSCSQSYAEHILEDKPVVITAMNDALPVSQINGKWVGLASLSSRGLAIVKEEIEAMKQDGTIISASVPQLFDRLIKKGHALNAAYVSGHWLDVNDAIGLANARNFT